MKKILLYEKKNSSIEKYERRKEAFLYRKSFIYFINGIRNDQDLKRAYVSNIAMCFYDSYFNYKEKYNKKSLNKRDILTISNEAAQGFMDLLCLFSD